MSISVSEKLKNSKLVGVTQVDFSFFNAIAPQVFADKSIYECVGNDIAFISQMGNQLFNYFNEADPSSQKLWYDALKLGCNSCVANCNTLITQIPQDKPKGPDAKVVLQELIADCQAIAAVIPSVKE